jgi:alpha-glucosidase
MLLTMRGSVCLYQGEELGLSEAELTFEDLVDPYGIEFWPKFKGRDGCRTPMVWQAAAHLGGFSTAPRAWLPVPAAHLSRAVDQQDQRNDSTLAFYRALLRFRKSHESLRSGSIKTLDAPEGVLAFVRGRDILCVFNMSDKATAFLVPQGMNVRDLDAPGSLPGPERGALSLPPFGAYIGGLS